MACRKLTIYAHTTALTATQSRELGADLTPAGPDHPMARRDLHPVAV
jgi:hypothetical protein